MIPSHAGLNQKLKPLTGDFLHCMNLYGYRILPWREGNMTSYFSQKKLLPEDTLKAITLPKGNNGSYFPSARVISGLYHAYKDW